MHIFFNWKLSVTTFIGNTNKLAAVLFISSSLTHYYKLYFHELYSSNNWFQNWVIIGNLIPIWISSPQLFSSLDGISAFSLPKKNLMFMIINLANCQHDNQKIRSFDYTLFISEHSTFKYEQIIILKNLG